MCKPEPGYTISPARYAGRWNGKPQVAVRCESDGSCMKTRAMRLIRDGLNARYSGREKAYIVSPAKAAKFERLFAEGWDACVMKRELEAPISCAA
jgi:hypothetical protein